MRRGTHFLWLACAVWLLSALPALAGGGKGMDQPVSLEELRAEMERLNEKLSEMGALKEKVRVLEQQIQVMSAATSETQAQEEELKKKGALPAFTFWKNDFYLETPDGDFSMRMRGNLHMDTKFYGGQSENPTQFDIRRARIDFQGMWYKYIQWRLQAEFADSPYIRNAWADYKFRDWLHLRGGQMKPPFSTSWWTLDNRVNFIERGASTPLYPYFDRGWLIWGDVLNNTLTWNASVFTGAGMDYDYNKGDIDDHKDYVGRLFFSPFKNRKGNILEGLHLCLQGTYSNQSIPTKRFETKGMTAQIRDDKVWKWQTESAFSEAEIGARHRWGGEIHYLKGPFSLSSEYLEVQYKDIEVFDKGTGAKVLDEDGRVTSWSTWVSYFLTGEGKSVSNWGWKQPNPKVNFNPMRFRGIGAWEVLARYTHTEVSQGLFERTYVGGNAFRIMDGAPWTEELTFGLCWTWNPLVRWQLNYTHIEAPEGFGDSGEPRGIFSGDSNNLEGEAQTANEDMVGLRMIFKF
jgi:phosphate-selective porin OprO/OprP